MELPEVIEKSKNEVLDAFLGTKDMVDSILSTAGVSDADRSKVLTLFSKDKRVVELAFELVTLAVSTTVAEIRK